MKQFKKNYLITFQEEYDNYILLGNYKYLENALPLEISAIIYKNNELYLKLSRNNSSILTFEKIIGDLPQEDLNQILLRLKYILNNYNNTMAYTKTINVTGQSMIEDVNVQISFNYVEPTAPTTANFSFTKDWCSVYGNCSLTEITNYSTNGGIITDEFMKLVQAECIRVLTNYETI